MSVRGDAVWYILREGRRFGPFSADEFARIEQEGHFRPTDQVWQPGMETWIAYSDYEVRKAAISLVNQPSSSLRAGSSLRRIMLALASTFAVNFHRPSTQVAAIAAVFDRFRASTRLAWLEHKGKSDQAAVRDDENSAAVRREQDEDGGTADVPMENVVEPLRPSPPTARLASEGQAAALIGLELATFRAWVGDGRLPHPLPDCGKYDMRAIHLALDRMSGICARENGANDWTDASQEPWVQTRIDSTSRDRHSQNMQQSHVDHG